VIIFAFASLIASSQNFVMAQQAPPALKTHRLNFPGNLHNRNSVAFSPDGKSLATAGDDNHIRLWDVATGKPTFAFKAHDAPSGIARVAFFPGGKKLASGGWAWEGTARLWDLNGKLLQRVGEDKGGLAVLAVSPNGKLLAWGNGGKIHLFDVNAGQDARLLRMDAAVDSVAFSPDGKLLATPAGGIVRLWEVDSGKAVRDLPALGCSATGCQAVAFSPDGKTLAVANKKVELWDVATGKQNAILGLPDENVFCIAISPNGRLLAVGTFGGTLRLWDMTTLKQVRVWNERATSVVFSRDSNWLAFGSSGGATLAEIER